MLLAGPLLKNCVDNRWLRLGTYYVVCVAFSISFHSKHIEFFARQGCKCIVMSCCHGYHEISIYQTFQTNSFIMFYENYFDTLMDTCKLHQSFYIIKTIFCKKKKKLRRGKIVCTNIIIVQKFLKPSTSRLVLPRYILHTNF